MDTGSPSTTDIPSEDTQRRLEACARACGVARDIIEKICPASEEQKLRMDHHVNTGSSYMMQIVLHHEGDLTQKNQDFLLRVLSAIRLKNHVLRSRLIKHEGQVYQIVLKDSIVFQRIDGDLHSFLAHNSRTRMNYGTPLCRYAFVRDPHSEGFLIWTVHCSAVDAWTLNLMFEELQTACSDSRAYYKLPSRPPYGRYTQWLQSGDPEARSMFWLLRHTTFENLEPRHRLPVLGDGDTPSTSTMKIKKLLHLPIVGDTEFSLSTMGHVAWALTIAKLRTQDHPPLVNQDVSFISMCSARESNVAGIRHMVGPISARVPLQIRSFPDLPIENLMRDIDTQLSAMIGFEHCAMRALSKGTSLQNMLKQAVFSWNPPGSDLASRRIVCHDKEVAPAVLAYREDLSLPFAHDYGLMFEVYEHGQHISTYASWDQNLASADLVRRLFESFETLLTAIIKTPRATVLELLSDNRSSRSEPVSSTRMPQRAGPPSI